jgi:hypothetical protein
MKLGESSPLRICGGLNASLISRNRRVHRAQFSVFSSQFSVVSFQRIKRAKKALHINRDTFAKIWPEVVNGEGGLWGGEEKSRSFDSLRCASVAQDDRNKEGGWDAEDGMGRTAAGAG